MKEKYKDRPASEGKHGDAAEEPNAGPPQDERDSGQPKPDKGPSPERKISR
jgi:hypothetical protein